jgi:hypothetical protein
MQIEFFLMIFYLFFDNVTDDEKDLRYGVYKLHGLIKQFRFKATNQINIEKRKTVSSEIEEIKNDLIKNSFYIKETNKIQKEFLNPLFSRLIKPNLLFEKTGLTNINLDGIWSLYSNHIHSEHIGDRQFNFIFKEDNSTDSEAVLILKINSILTAKLCYYLLNNNNSAKNKFNEMSIEEKYLIKAYNSPT